MAFSVDDGLLGDGEHLSIKHRSVTANVLLTRDFPVHVADILPMLRVFASCSVAEKIGRFVQENLQETASFPIGLTVPVKHSVSVKMRVTQFKAKTASALKFDLPTTNTTVD